MPLATWVDAAEDAALFGPLQRARPTEVPAQACAERALARRCLAVFHAIVTTPHCKASLHLQTLAFAAIAHDMPEALVILREECPPWDTELAQWCLAAHEWFVSRAPHG